MFSKSKITTLFLDIGGVLLSNGWGHDFRRQAAETFHLDMLEMEERHNLVFVTYEEGKITLDEYLNRVLPIISGAIFGMIGFATGQKSKGS